MQANPLLKKRPFNVESVDSALSKLASGSGYLNAGYPKFMELFGRDSIISGIQLLDYDSSILKHSLESLARLQGTRVDARNGEEPGKILHEFFPDGSSVEVYKKGISWLHGGKPAYFSVDSTPLFIIGAGAYLDKTGDLDFIKSIYGNMERAVGWMADYGLHDGFLRYSRLHPDEGLPSQSWKDGIGNMLESLEGRIAIVEVQGYAYMAFRYFGAMSSALGVGKEKQRYDTEAMAAQIKSNMRRFWSDKTGYYGIALDGSDSLVETVTSNPGQLLFTGILDRGSAMAVARRIMRKDMLTQYGIRTESSFSETFNPYKYQNGSVWPHDNWIIAQGLRRMGFYQEYEIVKRAVLRAYRETGTFPEYYGVDSHGRIIGMERMETRACDPQAWTVGAVCSFQTDAFINLIRA